MPDAMPIGDPRTQAALYGLFTGNFPGASQFAPGSMPITLAGVPPQGMKTDVPAARAAAFLQAMGAGSPGPVLRSAAQRLAAKQSPYRFVGSGEDKSGALTEVGLPNFSVQMPQGGQPGNF